MGSVNLRIVAVGALALASFAASVAFAQEACGLCARSVVVNSASAACFLEKYEEFAGRKSANAIAIDLEGCEAERGVVAALRGPRTADAEQPSLRFIVSAAQLACLKQRLETPAAPLDPSLKIDLASC